MVTGVLQPLGLEDQLHLVAENVVIAHDVTCCLVQTAGININSQCGKTLTVNKDGEINNYNSYQQWNYCSYWC